MNKKITHREIREFTWDKVRNNVYAVNATLAKTIDQIDPGKDLTFFMVGYQYGDYVVHNGILNLPDKDGNLLAVTDNAFANNIAQSLAYNSCGMPTGIVLEKSLEYMYSLDNRTTPVDILFAGKMFATLEALQHINNKQTVDMHKILTISSGAKSTYILPKISNTSGYNRLKKQFSMRLSMPITMDKHWTLFKEIINNTVPATSWATELLFFSNKWFQKEHNKGLSILEKCLLKQYWNTHICAQDQTMFDYAFSCALESQNLRSNPYLQDTVKHLYAIGQGNAPAFRVATDDHAAPISELKNIFLYIYDLEEYCPTMFHLDYMDTKGKFPPHLLYYSLQFPTLQSFSPRSRQLSNNLEDIRQIQHIIEKTSDELCNVINYKLQNSFIKDSVTKVKYYYFHNRKDDFRQVSTTADIPTIDQHLFQDMQKYPDRIFAGNGHMVRGCIGIHRC